MPKIPTFTARGRPTAEVASIKTNLKLSPTATPAAGLLSAAKAIDEYNIKRVQTAVRSDFDKGIRFAEWLGLENEGLMKHYGFDGSAQYRYARIF